MLLVCNFLNLPGTWNKDALVEVSDPPLKASDLAHRKRLNHLTMVCPCLIDENLPIDE